MKTLNSFIATTTIIMVAIIALLTSFTASANVYEDRLKEAFNDIINVVPHEDLSQMHTTYTDPETGVKEGQLDVYKFTIDSGNVGLINNAKEAYEQLNGNSNADVYTLWWNDNDDGTFQGYRLYYSPEQTIVVGLACDHCYTVGFLTPDDKQHRKTYTLEWSKNDDSDSISGRLITTYAPIKAKATEGQRISSVVISSDDYDKFMEKFQAGMEKYQQGMEKYQAAMEKAKGALSDLSDGQSHSFSFSSSSSSSSSHGNAKDWMMDLKIAMQQLASVYKQLKEKKKLKDSELLFLESMVDLLENKTK